MTSPFIYYVGDLCPFADFLRKQRAENKAAVMKLSDLTSLSPCSGRCEARGRSSECRTVRNALNAAKTIEERLGAKLKLKPGFVLVGSIVEGTRFGNAREMDITVTFPDLKNRHPLFLSRDAFSLQLWDEKPRRDENQHPLKDYASKDGKFDFQKFFIKFLDSIDEIVRNELEKIPDEDDGWR